MMKLIRKPIGGVGIIIVRVGTLCTRPGQIEFENFGPAEETLCILRTDSSPTPARSRTVYDDRKKSLVRRMCRTLIL